MKGGDIDFEDLNLEKSYTPLKAYRQSKLANILFTKELDKKLKGTNRFSVSTWIWSLNNSFELLDSDIKGITTYSLHPGAIASDLDRHLDSTMMRGTQFFIRNVMKYFIKNVEQGAQTSIHCAVDEKAGTESGLYYRLSQAISKKNEQ